ncbi:hypothetical protein JOF41_005974 [Saccharothrix coeruleofusca]|uniref:hypothetical protein n=1 Tax=Saccharothrix coeruleofusca TaxID=33919 RepID=UPI001AE73FEC|nr:hypothetical protein [Saccharothrix coeruleofusca]MBP2339796.1 hypothetical protein [Saccharothrix coeruleofusca]
MAALRQVVKELPFTPLADATGLIEDAKALIELAAAGSGDDEFRQVVARFQEVADGIGKLQQKLTRIRQSATALANRLEGQHALQTTSREAPDGARQLATPKPPAAVPTPKRVDELLAALPVRDDPGGKTSGYWVDHTGQVRGPVTSG